MGAWAALGRVLGLPCSLPGRCRCRCHPHSHLGLEAAQKRSQAQSQPSLPSCQASNPQSWAGSLPG